MSRPPTAPFDSLRSLRASSGRRREGVKNGPQTLQERPEGTGTPVEALRGAEGPLRRFQTLSLSLDAALVRALSPNGRSQSHWPRTKARERAMAMVAALARAFDLRPVRGRAWVTFRWVVPDQRRRDIDNLAGNGIVKATLDALVEGEWLRDDSTAYVRGVRTDVVYRRGIRRLEIEIEEEAP